MLRSTNRTRRSLALFNLCCSMLIASLTHLLALYVNYGVPLSVMVLRCTRTRCSNTFMTRGQGNWPVVIQPHNLHVFGNWDDGGGFKACGNRIDVQRSLKMSLKTGASCSQQSFSDFFHLLTSENVLHAPRRTVQSWILLLTGNKAW